MLPTSATAAAKSLQSRPTLCDPADGSPPGSSVSGTTNVINVHSYYLALKLPISTSHCGLLTHFCLGDYTAWGRVLFFETWEHWVFCLGSLYSAGLLYSSPAILFFEKVMLYSACARPSVSRSPTSKNHESHHSSTSSYRNSKYFRLPKMTSVSSPFTFENN